MTLQNLIVIIEALMLVVVDCLHSCAEQSEWVSIYGDAFSLYFCAIQQAEMVQSIFLIYLSCDCIFRRTRTTLLSISVVMLDSHQCTDTYSALISQESESIKKRRNWTFRLNGKKIIPFLFMIFKVNGPQCFQDAKMSAIFKWIQFHPQENLGLWIL